MLDNAIGLIGFTTVGVAYIYYTIWVLLTPFVEADNESFHSLFPDYYYAAVIPTAVLVACMLVVAVFAGCIFLCSNNLCTRRDLCSLCRPSNNLRRVRMCMLCV
jgi:dolichyl-phosphate mannosyltransferase polypeptide 2 regulatory subunit